MTRGRQGISRALDEPAELFVELIAERLALLVRRAEGPPAANDVAITFQTRSRSRALRSISTSILFISLSLCGSRPASAPTGWHHP